MTIQTKEEIKKQLVELRKFIDGDEGSELEKRIAYVVENAVRFIVEDVDWGDEGKPFSLVDEAKETAALINTD